MDSEAGISNTESYELEKSEKKSFLGNVNNTMDDDSSIDEDKSPKKIKRK